MDWGAASWIFVQSCAEINQGNQIARRIFLHHCRHQTPKQFYWNHYSMSEKWALCPSYNCEVKRTSRCHAALNPRVASRPNLTPVTGRNTTSTWVQAVTRPVLYNVFNWRCAIKLNHSVRDWIHGLEALRRHITGNVIRVDWIDSEVGTIWHMMKQSNTVTCRRDQ